VVRRHTTAAEPPENTEIAERLVLTESTVKKHVARVLAKIGDHDRIQAVITAYDTRLVRAKS
jgi:DNA-binding NarL/FixJ family response regulator